MFWFINVITRFLQRLFFGTVAFLRPSSRMLGLHFKARTSPYIGGIERFPVPDEFVRFTVPFASYNPVEYTAAVVLKQPIWADVPDASAITNWNMIDGKVDRKSAHGDYRLDSLCRPLNPVGRTGMVGRGLLGRWGPNHAADPIVTRWKRDGSNKVVRDSKGNAILQVLVIRRGDTGELALPGGMVDAGEVASVTVKREFGEEALNTLQMSEAEKKRIAHDVDAFFDASAPHTRKVYQGYVDDPRNTDNSWMETTAYNFHDQDGTVLTKFNLSAGDDAKDVLWIDYKPDLDLYASHAQFIREAADYLLAQSQP